MILKERQILLFSFSLTRGRFKLITPSVKPSADRSQAAQVWHLVPPHSHGIMTSQLLFHTESGGGNCLLLSENIQVIGAEAMQEMSPS